MTNSTDPIPPARPVGQPPLTAEQKLARAELLMSKLDDLRASAATKDEMKALRDELLAALREIREMKATTPPLIAPAPVVEEKNRRCWS